MHTTTHNTRHKHTNTQHTTHTAHTSERLSLGPASSYRYLSTGAKEKVRDLDDVKEFQHATVCSFVSIAVCSMGVKCSVWGVDSVALLPHAAGTYQHN